MILAGIEDILKENTQEQAVALLTSICGQSDLGIQLDNIEEFLSNYLADWENGCERRGRAIFHILDLLKKHINYKKIYESYRLEMIALIGKPETVLIELLNPDVDYVDDIKLRRMTYLDDESIRAYLLPKDAQRFPLELAIRYHPDALFWLYQILQKTSSETRQIVLTTINLQTWRSSLIEVIKNYSNFCLPHFLKILAFMPFRQQEIIYNNLPPSLFIAGQIDLTQIENNDAMIETNVRYYLHQLQAVTEKIQKQCFQRAADRRIVDLYDAMAHDLGEFFVDDRNWSDIRGRWKNLINEQFEYLKDDKFVLRILLNVLLCISTAGIAIPFVYAKVKDDRQHGRLQFGYFQSTAIEGIKRAQDVLDATPNMMTL